MTDKYKTSLQLINHIAQLAHIPLSGAKEAHSLREAFDTTLETFENLNALDLDETPEMHQVTGLENVLRDDEVDESRMFSQTQALEQAPRTHQGYFVVPEVLSK